jgi:hypothetical protein
MSENEDKQTFIVSYQNSQGDNEPGAVANNDDRPKTVQRADAPFIDTIVLAKEVRNCVLTSLSSA